MTEKHVPGLNKIISSTNWQNASLLINFPGKVIHMISFDCVDIYSMLICPGPEKSILHCCC